MVNSQNIEVKPDFMIEYALKINESLAAPQNFSRLDNYTFKDFFPDDQEKFGSTLQFYHSKRADECSIYYNF